MKAALDMLHLRKIDLADRVLIVNVGGYVGPSTQEEIRYAYRHGKVVQWYDPAHAWDPTAPVTTDACGCQRQPTTGAVLACCPAHPLTLS